MSFEFKLPDIGEGIAEGEITRWHVTEGQVIKEDDPFVEVMTDKATVEIPAPRAGVIQRIGAKEGETVPVGSVICVIDDSGASSSNGSTAAASAPAAPAAAAAPVAAAATPASAPAAPRAAASPTPAAPPPAAVTSAAGTRVLAAPAVRRRAREHGVDLLSVPGSGPAGRVTKADFDQFLHALAQSPVAEPMAPANVPATSAPTAPAAPAVAAAAPIPRGPVTTEGAEDRVPLRGIRKRIADRMSQSKRTAAHFTYVDEVDVTGLVAMRKELKPTAQEQGVKLTYMPFIVKAVTTALRKFPMLNASLDEATSEIVTKHYHNIGFAADTDAGLVVPVIKNADYQSLLGLGAVIQDLAARAREGRLDLSEVTGSTFTITNAGNIGGILATPVINYPEVAILGVHKIQERAVVKDGEIVVRSMMNLSISLDHRLVDGADGARFMNEVIRMLEDPKLLLLGSL